MATKEFALDDIMVLVRDMAGDVSAAVTSAVGWLDISASCKGEVSINDTIEIVTLEPEGGGDRGRKLEGDASASITLRMVRSSSPVLAADGGADKDGPAFFQSVYVGGKPRRFQFCIQERKTPLMAGNVLVPDASPANPQYAGSAFIQTYNPWGPGGRTTAALSITAEADSDYAVYIA